MAHDDEQFSVISDGLPSQLPDTDPDETAEWLQSLDAVVNNAGRGRARFLMLKLLERAREKAVGVPALRSTDFDHVLANPPYFRAGDGTPARNPGREQALREDTDLSAWVDAGLRRLRPGGWLTMIHLADRLADILGALAPRAGSVSILPIAARAGRPASRILIRARKGGRAPLCLLSPFLMHDGAAHLSDGDDYSAAAGAVLRAGAALPGFD